VHRLLRHHLRLHAKELQAEQAQMVLFYLLHLQGEQAVIFTVEVLIARELTLLPLNWARLTIVEMLTMPIISWQILLLCRRKLMHLEANTR
jgi:hypothetical protein